MQHKGHEIKVSEYDGKFSCEDFGLREVETYREICTRIESEVRKEKSVEKIPVFCVDYSGTVKAATGSTIIPNHASYSSGYDIWVTYENKKRSKMDAGKVYRDTPENRAAVKLYQSEISRIELEKEQAEETFAAACKSISLEKSEQAAAQPQ